MSMRKPFWRMTGAVTGGVCVGLCLGWAIYAADLRDGSAAPAAHGAEALKTGAVPLADFTPTRLPGADCISTSPWIQEPALVKSRLRPTSYVGTGCRSEGLIDLGPCSAKGRPIALTMTLAVPDAPPTDQVWRYDIRLDDQPTDTHYVAFGKPQTVRYDIRGIGRVKVRAVVWGGGAAVGQPLLVDPQITYAGKR